MRNDVGVQMHMQPCGELQHATSPPTRIVALVSGAEWRPWIAHPRTTTVTAYQASQSRKYHELLRLDDVVLYCSAPLVAQLDNVKLICRRPSPARISKLSRKASPCRFGQVHQSRPTPLGVWRRLRRTTTTVPFPQEGRCRERRERIWL